MKFIRPKCLGGLARRRPSMQHNLSAFLGLNKSKFKPAQLLQLLPSSLIFFCSASDPAAQTFFVSLCVCFVCFVQFCRSSSVRRCGVAGRRCACAHRLEVSQLKAVPSVNPIVPIHVRSGKKSLVAASPLHYAAVPSQYCPDPRSMGSRNPRW